jgi:hypothetical protein
MAGCGNNFLAGWYYGPYVSFQRAGYGDLDCSNAKLEVDLRYYKVSGNYADAPVFVRIYTADSAGNYVGYRDYSIVYAVQPPWNNPPYPTWTHVTVWLNNPALNPYTEGGTFSIGTVSYMRFYGTDWSGQEGDFIDAKKLVITDVPPQVNANAAPTRPSPKPPARRRSRWTAAAAPGRSCVMCGSAPRSRWPTSPPQRRRSGWRPGRTR